MIGNERLAPTARTKAAEKLITLEDAAGGDFLFEMLRSASADSRLAALGSLREWDVETDFSQSDRASRVLTLLNDPDERLVEAAAKLCTSRSIPGTESRLIALLARARLHNTVPIAEELAAVANSRRAVDVLLPQVLKADTDEFSQRTGYTFRKLLEHPDSEVSGPVRRAVYNYTLRFEKQRYDQILVEHLAKSAGQDAIPVLEDIVKNASDAVSRAYAVEALARLQPDKAVDLLIEHIEREGARSYIVRLLRQYATERQFDRFAPIVIDSFQKSGKQFDREAVRLFLIESGSRGQQLVKDHMNELDDDARMWATWKLEGMDLVAALAELHAAGVIRSAPSELLNEMQEVGNRRNVAEPLDTSDPDTLVAALAWDGIVTMFDTEADAIPCDHDRLILQFAEGSDGQFVPRWPVQFWHRASKDDYDGPYSVQFVFKNRLFRIGAENYGDWYDVDAVVRLINFALETVGQPQRFITLDSDGQIASFVFADPAAFLPIAKKYRLPLSEDASKAMREGIEFERRVIDPTN
jgi:HEAT repeat protein